jgi:K+-transporting ATPase ATPase C chain
MKTIIIEFGRSLVATVFFAIIVCGLYPLVVDGLGQVMFSHQANGSLLLDKSGAVRGSELLGQNFTSDKYFHPRPSAAGNGYDAANSGGTNFAPTNQKLIDRIQADAKTLHEENPSQPIPVDLLTTSASGLDPEISPAAAEFQVPRVARARGIPENTIRDLVQKYTYQRDLGLLGEVRVNVLELNLALDDLAAKP